MDPGSWKSEFLATIVFCKGPRATGVLCCVIILCWYKKRILWMSRKRAERASAVIDRSQSPRVRSDLPGISLFTKLLPLLQSSPPPAAHAHFTNLVGKQPKKHLLIGKERESFYHLHNTLVQGGTSVWEPCSADLRVYTSMQQNIRIEERARVSGLPCQATHRSSHALHAPI